MNPVVISFGGSVLAPDEPEPKRLLATAKAIIGLAEHRHVFVVVGGGAPARKAITAARQSGATETELDEVGIAATRLNARTFMAVLHGLGALCNTQVPLSTTDAAESKRQITVMGGTVPGHSTDFVGAELAVKTGADRLVIATNVDGVYSADPRIDPAAVRLDRLSHQQLLQIAGEEWKEAGQSGVVDGPASKLAAETGLAVCVVGGTNLSAVTAAAAGEPFHGTLVSEAP